MNGLRIVLAVVVLGFAAFIIVENMKQPHQRISVFALSSDRIAQATSLDVLDELQQQQSPRQFRVTSRNHTNSALSPMILSAGAEREVGDDRYAPNIYKSNNFPEMQLPFDIRGCKFVYLDLGTNEGYQLEKLYFGVKQHSGWAKKFNKHFGEDIETRRREVCAIGAEPDRLHKPTLDAMEKNLTALGVRMTVLRHPIWVNNDLLTFHSIYDPNWNHDASTLSGTETHTIFDPKLGRRVKPKNVTTYELRAYRLSTLLAQIPNGTLVLAKMDIEGAEHRVLTDIILDGTICAIRFLGIEAHPQLMRGDRHALSIAPKQLHRFLERSKRCPVWALEFDDET